MSEKSEKHVFKAEVRQLLDILVHSLYTSKEIFLRELISNASDALDKVGYETRKSTEVIDKDLPLEIKITFNDKDKILYVSDTGIGMSRSELIENIGTIAKSGSAEFLKNITESQDVSNIIGKFGVGFYSVFMVAKEVIVKTKSFKKDEPAIQWRSDGLGEYEIDEINEEVKRGTTVEIYLRDEAKEYSEKYKLETVIKKHSSFISFPIYLDAEKINTIPALWREPKSIVKPEQYNEFYKFLTYDSDDPFYTIHNSVDAPIQFKSLIFIPKKNYDMFMFSQKEFGLDLYVKRVLIQHKNKDLVPEYLSFVKGVVDSEDLPLNISRETLQENIIFTKISQTVIKNVYSFLIDEAKTNPENYNQFWKEHGKIFKLGYGDYSNQEKYLQLVRFNTSFNKNSEDLSSLEDYVRRMRENQKEIFYVEGSSREAIELDPHLEIFKKKGLEVIFLYEPADEFIISSLRKFKDYEFKSVDSVDLSNLDNITDSQFEDRKNEKLADDDEKHFSSLLEKMKSILGERISDVKESKRLVGSAAVLVNPEGGMASSMQKILRATGKDTSVQKKVLEINKDNNLVRNLLTIYKKDSNDNYIVNVTEQLFESALLLEGALSDPHKLVGRINNMLEQSSNWYVQIKK